MTKRKLDVKKNNPELTKMKAKRLWPQEGGISSYG